MQLSPRCYGIPLLHVPQKGSGKCLRKRGSMGCTLWAAFPFGETIVPAGKGWLEKNTSAFFDMREGVTLIDSRVQIGSRINVP